MAVASLKVPIDPAALIRIKIFQARCFDAAVHTMQAVIFGHFRAWSKKGFISG